MAEMAFVGLVLMDSSMATRLLEAVLTKGDAS